MALELRLPQLGVEMRSARLGEWLKQDGDPVIEGEPIAVVETDKVTYELPAPGTGILLIVAAVDEEYTVGDLLAQIAETEAQRAEFSADIPSEAARVPAAAETAENTGGTVAYDVQNGRRGKRKLASPLARRIAASHGFELNELTGTGPRGEIRRRDVEAALAARADAGDSPAVALVPAESSEGIPFSSLRRTIAARMLQSLQTTAQLTDVREIDVTRLVELRQRLAARAETLGFKVSFTDLLAKATAEALRQVPELNATAPDDRVIVHDRVHLGIAVSLQEGLIVPVVRNADRLSIRELHDRLDELAMQARNRTVTSQDLSGATFTFTNIGSYGSHFGTPILNPPQVGILAVGAILEKPIVADGQIVVGNTMYASLTMDHRVIDGEVAGRFQGAFESAIRNPETLLIL
jgi:pyruvate dehydrogenase E2 component (dihydrolipoamide acetyltransferase)